VSSFSFALGGEKLQENGKPGWLSDHRHSLQCTGAIGQSPYKHLDEKLAVVPKANQLQSLVFDINDFSDSVLCVLFC
jgi:hypothetical protein